MPEFTHLHVHTQYSILDGASKIPQLIEKVKNDGMKALAITDHGNLFGAKVFYNRAKKEGIKPIIGCEVYIAPGTRFEKKGQEERSNYHLILLAKNKKGYNNLIKLVSYAYIEGFYYKPRIDMELLQKYHEGIIASTACLGGQLPQAILNGQDDKIEKIIKEYYNIFGEDYYLELQQHKTGIPETDSNTLAKQQIVNKKLLELSQQFGIKCIATNDVHFVNEEDAEAHDRLICLNTNKEIDDPNRMHYTKQEYLKTSSEMAELFKDNPEALANTMEIADKVEVYELNQHPVMPVFPIPEEFGTEDSYKSKFDEKSLIEEFGEKRYKDLGGYNAVLRIKFESDYLAYLVNKGALKRYGDNLNDEIKERINFELSVIKKMGFPGYFLIVQDFLRAAREMDVSVGPGRGSAAGSCVAYCIKITDIDPIKYNLLFERFLNPERVSMPDIDIDFDEDGREEVLNYVVNKYGHEKVAHIITFGKMAPKMAIRDIGRVQKLPLTEADRLAKMVPERPGTTFAKAFKEVKDLEKEKKSDNELIVKTLQYAETLEGSVRQTGVHACGIIIGKDNLIEHIPLSTHKDAKLLVTQYDGKHVEDVGMLKMDFLGLKTLSIIKDAIEIIKHSKGVEIDIENIPLNDEEAYQLYSKGETTGLFQFESPGMKKHLKALKPNRFEDLIAMNALYRPGPMDYIPQFINRKHGREKIHYDFPVMEKYLDDTYGITVYQEQVMLLSQEMAGFTGGQADSLRKAMGKKIKSMMDDLKEKFVDGCKKNGYEEEGVLKIWSDWEKFAAYAFNKSHSTCYALVSYQTAYLKAHYPAEFMAAVLSRNLNDIKKITSFMDECKRMGLKVLGPDTNESYHKFTVNKDGNIRFGLGGIKGVGEAAVQNIIQEREKQGPFKSVFDFIERVNLRSVNKKNIEALAMAGAFDGMNEVKRHQFFCEDVANGTIFIETLLRYGSKFQEDKNTTQQSLFGMANDENILKPAIPVCEEWSNIEQLNKEKELIGIYLSAHPLDEFRVLINNFCTEKITQLKDLETLNGRDIAFAGIVSSVKSAISKNGKPYGSVTLEDFTDKHTITLFGKEYLEWKKYFVKGYSLYVKGKVKEKGWGDNNNSLEIKINSIITLPELWENIKKVTLKVKLDDLTESLTNDILDIINKNKGKSLINFLVHDPNEKIWIMMFSRSMQVNVTEELIKYFDNNLKLSYKLE
ncbi:MAG: DNA polymerase III subunit alpha [Chlorobi bacterium]|nr:DNA polymerase III subunit alpha [Chlorobiota bacterium]